MPGPGPAGPVTYRHGQPGCAQTSFTAALNPGDASVKRVTDNPGSTQDRHNIHVTGRSRPARKRALTRLTARGSTETVGVRTVTYAWARTGGTGDDTVAPSNPAALQTSFTAETLNPGDASVTHIFTLTVTDNQGSTQATDTVTFTVTAPLADPQPRRCGPRGSGH